MRQNKTPVSGYTGVFYSNENNLYYITLGGMQYFTDINNAALEHDRKAIEYFHDCAILNYQELLADYHELYAA